MSELCIREYQESDYVEVTEVINQLFHPIFSPFVSVPFEKGGAFIRDFEMINKNSNEGLYIVEMNNRVAGVMKLGAKEIKTDGMSISLKKIFKIYGFFKVIKAFMLFRALQTKLKDDEVYVDYIVVDKNHRSLGIGAKLLTQGMKKARELNKKRFTLNVLDNNPRGRALYERFGFEFVKESKYPKYVSKRLGAKADHRMEMKLV